MPVDVLKVRTPVFVDGPNGVTVRNVGSQTVYYGASRTVSSTTGTAVAAGAGVFLSTAAWFVCATGVTSQISVERRSATVSQSSAQRVLYVSNSGSNSNSGLTPALAWQTLSKVASSATTGDMVLLKRGDRWKESLTIPAARMTFGAYGADPVYDADGYCTNAPVVDGGEYATDWVEYEGGVDDRYYADDFTGSAGNLTTSTKEIGSLGYTLITGTANLAGDGTVRRNAATMQATTNTFPPLPSYYVEGVLSCKTIIATDSFEILLHADPSSTGNDKYLRVGLYTDGSSNAFSRVGWTATTNDLLDQAFVLAPATDYAFRAEVEVGVGVTLIRFWIDDVLIAERDFSTGATTYLSSFRHAPGEVQFRSGSASASVPANNTGIQLASLEAGPLGEASSENVYEAAWAGSSPANVAINGEWAPQGAGVNVLNDGEWYWKSSKLYVRSDAGAPSDTAVVGAARSYGFHMTSKAYVTVEDIAFEHTILDAVSINTCTDVTLRRVMAQRAGGDGATAVFGATCPGLLVQDCHIRECTPDAILVQSSVGVTVSGCRLGPVYGLQADCFQYSGSTPAAINGVLSNNVFIGNDLSPKGLVLIIGDNWLISENSFSGGRNFHIASFGNNVEVRSNTFYDLVAEIPETGGAFEITDNSATAVTNYQIHRNVFVDCNPAIHIWSAGTANRADLDVVANTVVNVAVVPSEGQVKFSQAISGQFRNNLVWNSAGSGQSYKVASVIGGSTWDSDTNLIGPEASNFISYTGTAYSTLATYQAGKSKDRASIKSDPLFVNPTGTSAGAFRLLPGSPAKSHGGRIAAVDANGPGLGAFDN